MDVLCRLRAAFDTGFLSALVLSVGLAIAHKIIG
jgi:hypothetical protein